MAKRITKKQMEQSKEMNLMIVNGLLQSLLISVLVYAMFGPFNETIVAILDTINAHNISAWHLAVIAFPIIFVCSTVINLGVYVAKDRK